MWNHYIWFDWEFCAEEETWLRTCGTSVVYQEAKVSWRVTIVGEHFVCCDQSSNHKLKLKFVLDKPLLVFALVHIMFLIMLRNGSFWCLLSQQYTGQIVICLGQFANFWLSKLHQEINLSGVCCLSNIEN